MTPAELLAAYASGVRYFRGADLSGADLSGARGLVHASVGWSGHSECGRTLLAVADQDGPGADVYYCGCFRGSLDDLRAWIARAHESQPALTESRLLCAQLVAGLLGREVKP